MNNYKLGLTVLARIAQRKPDQGRFLLAQTLEENLETLAPYALEVAEETNGAVGSILCGLFERTPNPTLSRRVFRQISQTTVALRGLALVTGKQALDLYRDGPPDLDNVRVMRDLASWMSDSRMHREAVELIQQALDLQMKQKQQAGQIYALELGATLMTMASVLSEAGHFDEAIEADTMAVELWDHNVQLYGSDYLPELAQSLTNLAFSYSKFSRFDDATVVLSKAIKIYDQLASNRPSKYAWDFFATLLDFAEHLNENEHQDQAFAVTKRALDFFVGQSHSHPSRTKPTLALAWRSWGMRLWERHQFEEAVEATLKSCTLHKELVEIHPGVYSEDFALSLSALANCYMSLGLTDEGTGCAQEAVFVLMPLFARYPVRFAEAFEEVFFIYATACRFSEREIDPEIKSCVVQIVCATRDGYASSTDPELFRLIDTLTEELSLHES